MVEVTLTEEELGEVDQLFSEETLQYDPHKEAIKTATIELAKTAKSGIGLEDLAKSTREILENFRFEDSFGKRDINEYLHTLWRRSNNGCKKG